MSPMGLLNRFRRWLGESRRNQILAAGAAIVAVGTLAAVGVVIAVPGDGDPETEVIALTATASPAAEAPTRTPRRTATSSPTPEVERPVPESLLQPGYLLDQALEVNLDGSEIGQIVVVSHTTYQVLLCSGQALNEKTGEPLPIPQSGCEELIATVPAKEDCSQNPNLDPAACWFRADVFAYDNSAGWTSVLVSRNHRGGVQDIGEAQTFRLDDGREAMVLAFHYCTGTGSGCGNYYEVIAKQGEKIAVAYTAWKALFRLDGTSVVFDNPAIFRDDAFCCPSGRDIDTLALDPATGKLGVIKSELLVCTEGNLTREPAGPNTFAISCGQESPVPGSIYRISNQTTVEPAAIGGLPGLRDGDPVRVDHGTECEGETSFCTLTAIKITVLSP